MGKGKYRSVWVKQIDVAALRAILPTPRVVVAIDVAKEDFYAAVMDESRRVLETVKWKHPEESPSFVDFVVALGANGAAVEVAMEPSGVYGDALRWAVCEAGVPSFRVSPKRSHDAAEVYDGVPSWHDPKSAAIIGKLHLDGASEPWPVAPDAQRELAAALRVLDVHEKEAQRNRNRLEGLLARHWPEVSRILDLDSATLLELLKTYGGPAAVAADPDRARALMVQVGGHFLAREKVEAVVASAASTFGMPPLVEESRLVMVVASEARRQQQASNAARRRVEELSAAHEVTGAMAKEVGKTTSAVLLASVGEPQKYPSAAAYEKAFGLNLKEKSSGKQQGALHLTKRGPGMARFFLYLAVLRKIQTDEVMRAWYARKVSRDGGKKKQKALVALMRKLVRALWYVARGEPYDSRKLFDTSRLALGEVSC